MDSQSSLAQALSSLKEADVRRLVKEKLDAGVPASDILVECREGMAIVGARFERKEYFIPELIFAGQLMKDLMADLLPRQEESLSSGAGTTGRVVIGTVQHDIHDIGKDIVVMMLQGTGFDVADLGVNVPPEKFVAAVRENQPAVLGMSVFLTSCCTCISETVEALEKAGLRDRLSIIIGGAAASDMVAERTGCNAYGETAMDAVTHALAVVKSHSQNA